MVFPGLHIKNKLEGFNISKQVSAKGSHTKIKKFAANGRAP
jgi:hypothetical protein